MWLTANFCRYCSWALGKLFTKECKKKRNPTGRALRPPPAGRRGSPLPPPPDISRHTPPPGHPHTTTRLSPPPPTPQPPLYCRAWGIRPSTAERREFATHSSDLHPPSLQSRPPSHLSPLLTPATEGGGGIRCGWGGGSPATTGHHCSSLSPLPDLLTPTTDGETLEAAVEGEEAVPTAGGEEVVSYASYLVTMEVEAAFSPPPHATLYHVSNLRRERVVGWA